MSVGAAAVSGFEVYKIVQLQGGGSVGIEFPGKDGKTAPPPPLPEFRRVGVWPGDEGEVRFADRLQSSARFSSVISPAAVSAILADTKTPADLKQLTEQEKAEAFGLVCKRAKVEFVFAAVSMGASVNSNVFSLARSNTTYTIDFLGFSCAQHRIVWQDQMVLVVDIQESMGDVSAVTQAEADAWADRVLQAPTTQ